MAAKDCAGFQEFPQAKFSTPSREEVEEQLCIAMNLKDGQQTAGQSLEDPYTRAVRYVHEHGIVEVLQTITARLAYEKPEDPLQFVLDEIAKVRQGKKPTELK